jgi:hypothetical protein
VSTQRRLVFLARARKMFYLCSWATKSILRHGRHALFAPLTPGRGALRLEKSDLIQPRKIRANECARACRRRSRGTSARDITCDGSVMAETAEICRCDGVMDRIASFSKARKRPLRFRGRCAYAVWYRRRHSQETMTALASILIGILLGAALVGAYLLGRERGRL